MHAPTDWHSLLAIVLLAIARLAFAKDFDNSTIPTSFFYSRPEIQPPALLVERQHLDKVAPGYVFIATYQGAQDGPYIYDKLGNLVWAGHAEIGPYNAHNPHVCQYKGKPHLCMFQGIQYHGYARGQGVILNTNYEIVKTVQSGGDIIAMDQHEFKLAEEGETALITIYQQATYDLSKIGITTAQGWVQDSIFQEINITDGSVIFEWSALANVDPFSSYVYPKTSDIAGDGLGPQTAWDWFHINSIDKSKLTGNYLISARHISSLLNINATDGSIIWRLESGGKTNFTCIDFNFTFQHDAQIRSENDTHMEISVYDNASNNYNFSAESSAGLFITLEYETMEARLSGPKIMYSESDTPLRSASQGNMQILENGNVFQGYGSWPAMTEHTAEGEPVWAANFGPQAGKIMSYRSTSGQWHAIPSKTKPYLWTYGKSPDGMIVFYVSWNGCTEVESWAFYGSNDLNDSFHKIGSTGKIGFETTYTSDTHFVYTFVEAIGMDGSSLRNSSVQQTFVPSAQLAAACTDDHCPGVAPPKQKLLRA